jgi:DNA-binding MarR family transcriptional regulator
VSIEKELQISLSLGALQKAHLNVLFTAGILYNRISTLLKPFDLTVEQFNVLRILKGAQGQEMCVKSITGRMVDRSSNVSRIIDRLVKKEWVIRKQSTVDKRESAIVLTQDGLQQILEVSEKVQHRLNEVMNLTIEEAELLNALLDKSRNITQETR